MIFSKSVILAIAASSCRRSFCNTRDETPTNMDGVMVNQNTKLTATSFGEGEALLSTRTDHFCKAGLVGEEGLKDEQDVDLGILSFDHYNDGDEGHRRLDFTAGANSCTGSDACSEGGLLPLSETTVAPIPNLVLRLGIRV
jgi:hypothetical protein